MPLEVEPSLDVEEDAAFSTRAVDENLEVEASFEEDEEDEGLICGVRAVEEVGLLSALLDSVRTQSHQQCVSRHTQHTTIAIHASSAQGR